MTANEFLKQVMSENINKTPEMVSETCKCHLVNVSGETGCTNVIYIHISSVVVIDQRANRLFIFNPTNKNWFKLLRFAFKLSSFEHIACEQQ